MECFTCIGFWRAIGAPESFTVIRLQNKKKQQFYIFHPWEKSGQFIQYQQKMLMNKFYCISCTYFLIILYLYCCQLFGLPYMDKSWSPGRTWVHTACRSCRFPRGHLSPPALVAARVDPTDTRLTQNCIRQKKACQITSTLQAQGDTWNYMYMYSWKLEKSLLPAILPQTVRL